LVDYAQCLHAFGQTTFLSSTSESGTADPHITYTRIYRLQQTNWKHELRVVTSQNSPHLVIFKHLACVKLA